MGYIGLPTATVIAKVGHEVIGVDIEKEKVEKINKGLVYIKEPDLDTLLKEVVSGFDPVLFLSSYHSSLSILLC